jgi:hypothetical protein
MSRQGRDAPPGPFSGPPALAASMPADGKSTEIAHSIGRRSLLLFIPRTNDPGYPGFRLTPNRPLFYFRLFRRQYPNERYLKFRPCPFPFTGRSFLTTWVAGHRGSYSGWVIHPGSSPNSLKAKDLFLPEFPIAPPFFA